MEKVKDVFFNGKNIRGEVGIEIEMEGKNLILNDVDNWYSREDGSLRGAREHNSREYVLIRPSKREDTLSKLASLAIDLKEAGATIDKSYRTGVHIHTNVRDFTFNQLFTFIFMYYMFEDVMMEYAGKERVGNLFCLRVRDAEGITTILEKAIKEHSLFYFDTDNIRYSSLNLKSLHQYGSLEFRGLPFNGDFENIQIWIDLLLAIKDASLKIENPREILASLSKKGGDVIAKEVFGDLLIHFPKIDWRDKLLDSVRLVQRLVYLTDWDEKEDNTFVIKTKLEAIKVEDDVAVNPLKRLLIPKKIVINNRAFAPAPQ